MPAKQKEPSPAGQGASEADHLNAVIGRHVLLALGRPDDWHRVQVRLLWAHHYRANVLVGVDITSARVAHSYFLVTDGDGNILQATPQILKRY